MSHAKWYYSLRCKGNRFHPSDSCRNYDARQVNLGETPDCDVRYEAGEYDPEAYATIIRNDDGESWRIVKRSGHVSVTLDGQGDIGYGRQLHDGDIIHIEGQPMPSKPRQATVGCGAAWPPSFFAQPPYCLIYCREIASVRKMSFP